MAESRYTRDIFPFPNYEIGAHTYGRPTVHDWHDGTRLVIGKYTSIADEVTILLGGNHRTDWATTYPFPALAEAWPTAAHIAGHPASKGDIVIGNDVWIGNGATILSGVNIGDGAVVAARAVVTKSVEPYTIVGGNPARPLKRRFSKRIIKQLLALKWWDWPDEVVAAHVNLLCSANINQLLKVDPRRS